MKISTPRWCLPLLKPSRYKGIYGGRGSGKSHFFAELGVEHLVINPQHRMVCIREVQRTLAQSVKRLIEDKIISLDVGHLFDVTENEIRTKHGGLIIFIGMQDRTAESIKSLEGYDIAWVEEAQSLSQRSLDLLRPTIRSPQSELWFSWNPRYPSDPVDRLLREDNPLNQTDKAKPPPGTITVKVNGDENPWFPKILLTEMEYDRSRDIDRYNHVWRGAYLTSSEATVFHNWSIREFNLIPTDHSTKPPYGVLLTNGASGPVRVDNPGDEPLIFRFGADWGFAKDPTVLVRCFQIDANPEQPKPTIYIDHEAWSIGCEITDTPNLFKTIPESLRYPIIADSARPEIISHMRKQRFNIIPSKKGAKSVEEGIRFLKSYDMVVHPRCKHTIDELTTYSYKIDTHTNAILPVLKDTKNHVIDSLRYAFEGVRRVKTPNIPKDFKPLPTRNMWNKKR